MPASREREVWQSIGAGAAEFRLTVGFVSVETSLVASLELPTMRTNLEIPFVKYHGLANDFIVTRHAPLPKALADLARAISNRHTGVGADGFLVVLPARQRKHHARVRFFNADGSEAEMSGNGIRCVGAFLTSERGPKGPLEIETAAGVKSLHLVKGGRGMWVFRVGMGKPVLTPRKIPFRGGKSQPRIVGFPMRTHRGLLPVTVTSMGNPHCTVFVADFPAIDWARLGREIELSSHFPNRTNVEFVKVVSRKEISVRFWERGVGETMSSGTGSCAAVVACILNGRTARKVRVRTPAGDLEVAWPEKGEVTLTGPVEKISEGTYYYPG
jgi:diaminopimelate epimerase